MPVRQIFLLLLLVSLAAFAAGGCGSSGGSGTAAGAYPSKPEYIAMADGVCARRRASALANFDRYRSRHDDLSRSESFVEGVRRTILPAYQAAVDEFAHLQTPFGDRAHLQGIQIEMQREVHVGMGRRFARFSGLSAMFHRSGEMLRRYGIDGCAYD